MLIILEGPDCAGKSTLAGALVARLAKDSPSAEVNLLHRGPPEGRHPLDEYAAPLFEFDPREPRHIVCDRWHLGEVVYPIVKGRPTSMTPGVHTWIEKFLMTRGAFVGIVNPSYPLLKQRLNTRGDDHVDEKELWQIREQFDLLDMWHHRTYHSAPTVDDILASAGGVRTRVHKTRFTTYVGPYAPELVLVGDRRHCSGVDCQHGKKHSVYGPAFAPYPATSGQWLMDALAAAGKGATSSIGFINVNDVDDIGQFYEEAFRPKLVALGVNASHGLDARGLKHSAIPHPQYMRRFHHHKSKQYTDLIIGCWNQGRNHLTWRPS
jgi:hypothetical protein